MAFTLPELPWAKNALAPLISEETINFHYGKHHNAYVTKLNDGIKGTKFENSNNLEEVIMNSEGGLFNNAAQVWNHTFYWNCLAPNAGGNPSGKIAEKINNKFGSFENFQNEFNQAAATNFGSGWTWLVENNGELEIFNTANADLPMKHNRKALLTIDVWEHAYYVDYRNARPDYINAFWKLVNWDFVNSQLS